MRNYKNTKLVNKIIIFHFSQLKSKRKEYIPETKRVELGSAVCGEEAATVADGAELEVLQNSRLKLRGAAAALMAMSRGLLGGGFKAKPSKLCYVRGWQLLWTQHGC